MRRASSASSLRARASASVSNDALGQRSQPGQPWAQPVHGVGGRPSSRRFSSDSPRMRSRPSSASTAPSRLSRARLLGRRRLVDHLLPEDLEMALHHQADAAEDLDVARRLAAPR